MNIRRITFNGAVILTIVFLCLCTVLIQGTALSSIISGNVIWTGCGLIFFLILLCLFVSYKRGSLSEEQIVFSIIFAGMLFHCCYVLLTGLYERQHDAGAYTGIASEQINAGHIGYAEYIYKFHKLPDINPYELFSYYHPPLHHIIAAFWLTLLTRLGMPEDMAFENLQALPLFYSGLFMFLTYLILKKIGAQGKGLYAGVFLIAMHPAIVFMSGSVNNDMLSIVLQACCILFTLCYIRDRNLKNLILIAFSIGLGMVSKLHTAVLAFPIGLIFLADFVEVIRDKNKELIVKRIVNYAVFGVVSAVIGLSWIVRNLVRYHVPPGVPTPGDSVMYTGDYGIWARIGIPAWSDWHFDFPFHPLSGKVIHNTWVIMFQTSLFAEEYPAELSGMPLFLCRFAYIMAIIFAILSLFLFLVTQYQKIKSAEKINVLDGIFLSTGYGIFLLGYIAFIFKYPYTCSSDFRYIIICLVYIAIGLADSDRFCSDKKKSAVVSRIIQIGVCATLILTTIIYMTWGQW